MDDELPKCGCGGEAVLRKHARAFLPAWTVSCTRAGCRIRLPDFNTADDAAAAWTRAMSAQAPGMEAMREAATAIMAWYERDGSVGGLVEPIDQLRAALQAAERVKEWGNDDS